MILKVPLGQKPFSVSQSLIPTCYFNNYVMLFLWVIMYLLHTLQTCFNISCGNSILLHILQIYIFVQHFLSYFHSADCKHNIRNIWLRVLLRALLRVFESCIQWQGLSRIYRHLRLFTTHQPPLLTFLVGPLILLREIQMTEHGRLSPRWYNIFISWHNIWSGKVSILVNLYF